MRLCGTMWAGLALALSQPAPAAEAPAAPGPASPAAAPVEVYGDLPGIEDMALSPGGKRIAIVMHDERARRLLVVEGGKALLSATVGDAKLRGLRFAGEETVLLTKSNTVALGPGYTVDRQELFSVLVVPLNTGKIQMVFGNSNAVAGAVFGDYGVRQVDGRWTGFYGGLSLDVTRMGTGLMTGQPTLFAVDLADNRVRRLVPEAGSGHDRRWLVDGNGRVAASMDLADGGSWQIRNGAGTRLAGGVDPTGDVAMRFLGKDGASVIYTAEDDAAGVTRWLEVPLAGGEGREVFADITVDRFFLDPRDGRLMGYVEAGTVPRPVFYDARVGAAFNKVYRAFAKRNPQLVDWTPDASSLLVHTSGSGDSGTWYRVDVARLQADPVGYDRPRIAPAQVGPVSRFAYRAADGLAMDGILTLPPRREARKLPVVLLPHGGPTAHDEVMFDWWAQAFAAQGYAVLQPNFRGSTNVDSAFRRAGNGEWGRKMQSDISDGLAELARQGIVDPARACIVGASYGGYAALAGVTLQQGLYRCAVAVAPVSDLAEMSSVDLRESGNSKLMRSSLRELLGNPAGLAAVSPRRFAARADAPIMLIHGKDDTVVPLHQSTAMASALKGARKPYEMVVLPGEDHWLSRAATRQQMLAAALRFVRTNNPPE